MKAIRRGLTAGAAIVLIMILILTLVGTGCSEDPGTSQTGTLVFNYWGTTMNDAFVQPLVLLKDRLEEETQGRYTADIFVGGVLGKSADSYDMVVRGIADVSCWGTPYTPGVFPMIDVFSLPVWAPTAEVANKAMIALYNKGYFDEELADVKVLGILANQPYDFGWTEKPVTTLADFAGMKVRTSPGVFPNLLTTIGAVPVTLSMLEVYDALARGIVDGTMFNHSMNVVLGFQEVLNYVTETRFAFFPMVVGMNKETYANLPKDVQAIIDGVTLEEMAAASYQIADAQVQEGMDLFLEAGGEISRLLPDDELEVKELWAPVVQKWEADMNAAGRPGTQLLDDLISVLDGLGVSDPIVH